MQSIYTQRKSPEHRAQPVQRTYPTHKAPPTRRCRRKKKSFNINRGLLAALVIANLILSCVSISLAVNDNKKTAEVEPAVHTETVIRTIETKQEPVPVAAFKLTSEQRTIIEQVVSGESRGEPYDGQVAVAQCILNACLKDGITPEEAIEKYDYTGARVKPTDSVKEAVAAVFDRGEGVTDEPILYFYAHKLVKSNWHESQNFVIEIGNHRFFKEAE